MTISGAKSIAIVLLVVLVIWLSQITRQTNIENKMLKEQIRLRDSVNAANKEVLQVYKNRTDSLQQFVAYKRY